MGKKGSVLADKGLRAVRISSVWSMGSVFWFWSWAWGKEGRGGGRGEGGERDYARRVLEGSEGRGRGRGRGRDTGKKARRPIAHGGQSPVQYSSVQNSSERWNGTWGLPPITTLPSLARLTTWPVAARLQHLLQSIAGRRLQEETA